jgi:DNA-binding transcriptional LysR family regulator
MSSLTPLYYLDVIARAGSIRKAAEVLSITSTALNRRVLALEAELGAPLFERLSRGVRPSAAGDLLISHVRRQTAEAERMKSEIAELNGQRRGRVAIACSQAFLPYFLPEQIARFRTSHPGVAFTVLRREREAAERALLDHLADIALVVEPVSLSVMHTAARLPQDVYAVLRADHPLAAMQTLRFEDCLDFPIGLPTGNHAVRQLVDLAVEMIQKRAFVAIESDSFDLLRNYTADPEIITFQIPVGLPTVAGEGVVHRRVDPHDLRPAEIFVGHLWGRSLPTAAASFLEQIVGSIAARR